ncbi:adhesion G protein-coupled receptor E2-like [Salvelinus fontinalis]|uniref:adhesion G protein-coupled receptor E2-like n=1 Tax=Salvelinus fontinalis TaxID=8038 RepID=UPI002486835E|nr:adhesion G protein-coupled receptor E2-like [Salvelinus fontinalis]
MGAIIFLLILAFLKDYGHGAPQKGTTVCVFLGLLTTGATQQCLDIDECVKFPDICGKSGTCRNQGCSYLCHCPNGFRNSGDRQTPCVEKDKCVEIPNICGKWGTCLNQEGSYLCQCPNGFRNSGDGQTPCVDIDECNTDGVCGKGGICQNMNGSYWCQCPAGFTNFGKNQTKCVELNCDQYETQPGQTLPGFDSFLSLLRNNCLVLNNSTLSGPTRPLTTGDGLLTLLVNTTDVLQLDLQSNGHRSSSEVTKLLRTIEISIRLIAPLLTENVTRIETNHTEVEIMVRRDKTSPKGPVSLTNENTQLDTTWETVVGDDQNYPGFAFVVLLSYKNLDSLKDNTSHQSQQLMSSAATVSVSNSNTANLPQPVNLTFNHLQSSDVDPTCVYWSDENGPGVWSGRGCTSVMSNSNQTVCSCNHLSTFAMLKGIHQRKGSGQLSLVMWVGVFVALTCVVLSLITTLWCRHASRKRRGGHRRQQDVQLHRK